MLIKEKDKQEQEQNASKLADLMLFHPLLEVVPIISHTAVDEDFIYTLGKFGGAYIDSYYDKDERFWFKNVDEEELVEKIMDDSDIDDEDTALNIFNSLEWIPCICVYIEER
jgi:hypothetical protein